MSANQDLRERRRERLRFQLRQKSGGRVRLSVFRSSKHIYAQVIDDAAATVRPLRRRASTAT
jgi:large subunit ribosomal protein L18